MRAFGRRTPRIVAAVAALGISALATSTARAEITALITWTPDVISTSQVSTLRVLLANSDIEDAEALTVNHALPAGLAIAPWPNLLNTCGGAIALTPGGVTLGLADGVIPAATSDGPGTCAIAIDLVPSSIGQFVAAIAAGAVTTRRGNLLQGAAAMLRVEKDDPITGTLAFSPDSIHGNPLSEAGAATVTITLTNSNGVAVNGVSFTDTLPNGIVLARPPNAVTTCPAGTFNNPQPLATSIQVTKATIPPGQTCTFAFQVFIAKETANTFSDAILTNTIPAGAITTKEGVSNASLSGSLRIQTGAQIIKTFNPTTIFSGGAPTLQLEFRNFTASALTSISLTDNLPTPMQVASPTDQTSTCGGTVSASPGNANFSFTNGRLDPAPAGAGFSSCTVTISPTVINTTASPLTLTNRIDPNVFGGVQVAGTAATLTVIPANNITVQKGFTGIAVQTGVVTLTIGLKNNQSQLGATGVSFTDDLQATMGQGYTLAASPSSDCPGATFSSGPGDTAIRMTSGTIPPGTTCTITAAIQIGATAVLGIRTNTIPAGAPQTSLGSTITAATASVTTLPALRVAKDFAPSTVVAGQDARLTTTISHTDGAVPFTNLSLADGLPPGHAVSATPDVANTCGGTLTAVPGASAWSLAGGVLSTGSCSVTLNVTTPLGAGAATNTIPVGAVTTAQGVTNGSSANATLVRIETALSLTKSFEPDAIVNGGMSTLRLTIANSDPSALALTGGTLTDSLPPGLVVADPANASFSGSGCSGAVTASPEGSVVSLSGAMINVSAVCVLQVTVRATTAGSFFNRVDPGTVRTAEGVTNAVPASALLTATGLADLGLTMLADVSVATPGTNVSYTITVTNAGPDSVAGAVLTDPAPAGTVFTAWTCTPSTGALCAAGTGDLLDTVEIPAGGSLTYFVTARITASLPKGSLINTASIASPIPGPDDDNPVNNTATVTLPVIPAPIIHVFKTDRVETYVPGAAQTYLVTVTNLGPSDAANVTVTDQLPSRVVLDGTPICLARGAALCGGFSTTAGAVTLTGGRIPAGLANSLLITIPVLYPADLAVDPLVNTALARDEDSGVENVNSDTDLRRPSVVLSVGVDDGVAAYVPGQAGTYVVTVTDPDGITDALNVSVDVPLPPGVTSGSATCTPTGTAICGTVVVTSGGTRVQMTGARLGAGAGNNLVLTLPVAFASSLTTDPLDVTATATDLATGSSAAGRDTDARLSMDFLTVGIDDHSVTYTPGADGTYTVTVINGGQSDALDVRIEIPLPPGVTLQSTVTCAPGATASCGTITGGPGDTSVTVLGASLPVGQSLVLTMMVVYAPDLTADPIVITASATSSGRTATGSNSDALAQDVMLSLSKIGSAGTYRPGGSGTYTIVVSNAGLSDALNVSLVDPLPAGVTLTGVVTCTAQGNAICGTVSGVAGASMFQAVGARVGGSGGGTLTFVAPVAFAANLDTDPLANTTTASDSPSRTTASGTDLSPLVPTADLSLVKTGPETVASGAAITYTLTIANAGPSPAHGAKLSDDVPAGITQITATCSATGGAVCGSVSVAGNRVESTAFVLPAGGSLVVTVSGVAPQEGTLVNVAAVAPPPGTGDPNPANNIGRVTTVVTAEVVAVPVLSPAALALLVTVFLLSGWLRARRARRA